MIFLSCPKVNVLTKIIVDCVCLVLLAVYVLVGQTYAFNGLDIAIIVVNSLYTLAYARQLLCKWVPGMPNYLTKAGLINYLRLFKVGCVFPMVVVSILPHAEIGPNDHREDALHFIVHILGYLKT